jgi:hypothetical protein
VKDRFRQTAEERKEIAKFIKQTLPEVSNRQMAKALGVDHKTVAADVDGENSPRNKKNQSNINADEWLDGENSPGAKALSGAAAAKLVERRDIGAKCATHR